MLTDGDAVVLAPGVVLDGDVVVDDTRGLRLPVNAAASFVLRRAGQPLGAVAGELARRHRVDVLRARDDVLGFAWMLNRAYLVNIRRGETRLSRLAGWVALACRLAPSGTIPSFCVRRVAVDTSTRLRAAAGAARATAARGAALGLVAIVVGAPGGVHVGTVAMALGLGAGLAAHEAGHTVFLTGTAAALVLSGHRITVLHRPLGLRRRALVAVAGPAAAAGMGATAVVAATLAGVPELALAGCGPAAHAVGLTVATGDGRRACGL